jgi:hypothetical protein
MKPLCVFRMIVKSCVLVVVVALTFPLSANSLITDSGLQPDTFRFNPGIGISLTATISAPSSGTLYRHVGIGISGYLGITHEFGPKKNRPFSMNFGFNQKIAFGDLFLGRKDWATYFKTDVYTSVMYGSTDSYTEWRGMAASVPNILDQNRTRVGGIGYTLTFYNVVGSPVDSLNNSVGTISLFYGEDDWRLRLDHGNDFFGVSKPLSGKYKKADRGRTTDLCTITYTRFGTARTDYSYYSAGIFFYFTTPVYDRRIKNRVKRIQISNPAGEYPLMSSKETFNSPIGLTFGMGYRDWFSGELDLYLNQPRIAEFVQNSNHIKRGRGNGPWHLSPLYRERPKLKFEARGTLGQSWQFD